MRAFVPENQFEALGYFPPKEMGDILYINRARYDEKSYLIVKKLEKHSCNCIPLFSNHVRKKIFTLLTFLQINQLSNKIMKQAIK